ncbi:MAG: beta-lactamase family protein [Candidatus Aenigmarchaeota archaeon]|nr:beta-lactamase family protein [Candidatus Aenigmarchaeota archaeon]
MSVYDLLTIDSKDVENRVCKLMEKYDIPGLSIAAIQDFRIKNLMYLGIKKIGEKVKIDKNTIFQVASISKFFTALIIMKLVVSKKLRLNDDANKYLHGFKIKTAEGEIKKVTIKQLMSHTGGISCSGFKGYSYKEKVPKINEILNSEFPSNNERILVRYNQNTYHYSGGGYVVLQKIIENVTEDAFENVAKRFIFKPLNMNRSFFNQVGNKPYADFASGHEGKNTVKNDFFKYPEKSAAGLWTTAEDIAKLLIEILLCYKGKSEKILDMETIKMVLKPVTKAERNLMGLGIFISKNRKFFYHSGSNVGYRSKFVADLKGNGIVILTNSSKGYDFINELVSWTVT